MSLTPQEKWQQEQQKGIFAFIIKTGFVKFAIPGGLLYAWLVSQNPQVTFWNALPRALSVFTFAGFFFGLLIWFLMNRKFRIKDE